MVCVLHSPLLDGSAFATPSALLLPTLTLSGTARDSRDKLNYIPFQFQIDLSILRTFILH